MINSVTLKNFKSYRSARLQLSELTVLIGANASGKSNLIEALRFLAKIAQGERLGFINSPNNPRPKQPFRGQVEDLFYQRSQPFSLKCELESATCPDSWGIFEIQVSLTPDGELYIEQESIRDLGSNVPLYEIISPPQGAGSDVYVAYNNFARGGKKPKIVCSSQMAIFTQLLSEIRFREENKESRQRIPKIAQKYVNTLNNIIFLQPEPSLMRNYSHKTDKVLTENGENLSGVIYNIFSKPYDLILANNLSPANFKDLILEFICSLPEQNIKDIQFIETPRGEVMLQLIETFGGQETAYDVTMLSDGTLRVLAIVAVLCSAPQKSLVVIEEIDNGIHPSRVNSLLEKIVFLAGQRNLKVLISTHNPALLDAIPDFAIPNTVFCYRSPTDGSSQLVTLQNIPDYPELIAQGTVGHLMTTGILERFVKEYPGAEEKRKKALDWFASLNS
ncbi:AAA family ATPase [Spirulina subsalsa]|uniref:AAA family ATPase n=1 Tax=Spirulina subsalsa TaxID=54311 RepID=UPI00031EF8D1|nr:ATP-binding protein [Spirulina subsalsa]